MYEFESFKLKLYHHHHNTISICPSVCLFVHLSVYYLLRRLRTDPDQTRHEGWGWSNLEPYHIGFHGNHLLQGSAAEIGHI